MKRSRMSCSRTVNDRRGLLTSGFVVLVLFLTIPAFVNAGGAGVSEEASARTERDAWCANIPTEAKSVEPHGLVQRLSDLPVGPTTKTMKPRQPEPELLVNPVNGKGAVYGQPFSPAIATVRRTKAVDPVSLTGLTRSGNSTDGWTLDATWSGGVAPYTAVAGSDPSFQFDVTTIGMEMNGTSAQITVDPGESGQFFNVVDGSTVSPAVQGLGYDLLPAPETTSASTTNTWWGQEITLYGNYLSPIAKDNLAFMYDLPVKGASSNVPTGSRFANAVTFEVPEDARAFPAIVSTLGKWRCCFADAPWVTMSAPTIGPYTDITGLEWSPLSGNVWVSATGVVEEIDLFNQVPSVVWTTGSFTLPYISRTTTTGTVLVIDKTSPGEIREIDSGGGAQHFAWTTDDGFTRTVTPVGLAVDPDGSAAYIADAADGRVVRVPRGAGPGSAEIVDAWGGMYYLGFGDPCGIDVAPTHEVLMVNENDGYTYKLTGPSTTWLDKGVGTGIHSLDIDRDVSSAAGLYYVTSHDRASIEAFNTRTLNAGGGPRFHGGRIFGLGDGTLVLEPDFVFAAYRHFPQKVILSNEVEEYPYPSQYQIGDRVIRMDGQGWEGIDVHLRLIDPPDLAPYAPEGGWPDPPDPDAAGNPAPAVLPYEGNDNAGYADSDYGLSLYPDGPWTMTLQATPVRIGNNDIYTYYLKVPENYSGDNYQVEITKCDANGTVLPERVAGMSSVYTSWKRIFVERDSMFRKGGVLAEDYDPDTCGGVNLPCDQIRVYEWTNVVPGDFIMLFDEWSTAEGLWHLPSSTLHPVREVVTVWAADSTGRRILTLDSPLDRPFVASPFGESSPGGPRQPTFCDDNGANCHVSGFGVVSVCDLDWNQLNAADSCFFNVDLRGVERSFGDAFVEVHAPREGRNFLPFLPRNWMNWAMAYGSPGSRRPTDHLSWNWFHHRSEGANNYQHVIGAGKAGDYDENEFLAGLSQRFFHWSYVFRATIEDLGLFEVPPANIDQVHHHTEDTTVHELGHQFNVQACSDGGHHNDQLDPCPAWCSFPLSDPPVCPPDASSPELCLMNNGEIRGDNHQAWDPVMRFCRRCLLLGDSTCSPGPNGFRDGAIRTAVDPLIWD